MMRRNRNFQLAMSGLILMAVGTIVLMAWFMSITADKLARPQGHSDMWFLLPMTPLPITILTMVLAHKVMNTEWKPAKAKGHTFDEEQRRSLIDSFRRESAGALTILADMLTPRDRGCTDQTVVIPRVEDDNQTAVIPRIQ